MNLSPNIIFSDTNGSSIFNKIINNKPIYKPGYYKIRDVIFSENNKNKLKSEIIEYIYNKKNYKYKFNEKDNSIFDEKMKNHFLLYKMTNDNINKQIVYLNNKIINELLKLLIINIDFDKKFIFDSNNYLNNDVSYLYNNIESLQMVNTSSVGLQKNQINKRVINLFN